MITVLAAPPSLTVQDEGREGYRALGVPPSGSADRESAHALNRLVGNAPGAALLEWAAGGGALRFEVPLVIATGGAVLEAALDGAALAPWTVRRVRAGAELHVTRVVRGRFAYIAVRGGIDVPVVLGSRSTLASAELGGHAGRRLRAGDVLRVGGMPPTTDTVPRTGTVAAPPHGVPDIAPIPILPGPHLARLRERAWQALLATGWRVSSSADRAGVRLEGSPVPHEAGGWPSEPTCVGAVQLPPDGQPIVLLPDGPTVGGYPIVAVVRRAAIGRFAQRAPGDVVRFTAE